jgi:6-pyruvoyltetrahydropterin/6-carboxytetrahydropterin synthase
MEVYREFKFDAAHLLPNLPPEHKCGKLHGHTFRAVIHLDSEVGKETGWVRDFGEIRSICAPVIDKLDHSYLNDVRGLENPTSENIAKWLWQRLKPLMPELSAIEIKETSKTGCMFRGPE